jgi:hypothetical protein
MPDEKAEVVATYSARGREDAPAAPRHASLIVFVEINCFRPGIHSIARAKACSFPSPWPTPAS